MRRLSVSIFRYDPKNPDDKPRYQEYIVDEIPRMTIYQLLEKIQTEIDPSLYFDVVCRSNVCGSCAININGQPKLACRTQTSTLPDRILLEPLYYFPIIKDLATDKADYFFRMNRLIKGWLHTDREFNPELEHLVSAEEIKPVYDADRCIECGICIEACGAAKLNKNYLGATGFAHVFKFVYDKRDKRTVKDMLDVLSTEDGVFGCEAMLGCRDFCPKEIDLPKMIAQLRNKVVKQILWSSFKNLFKIKR